MMRADCIVFDLDGTLVDSLPDIATHLNAALVEHGCQALTYADIAERVGHGAEYLVRMSVPQLELADPVIATFRARYQARPVIESRLYPGLAEILDRIARRKLAVLSNKPHAITVAVADVLLAKWPFQAIIGKRDGHPFKPDPASLRELARELDVDVGACVLVGDTEVDVETARAAGATSIGVTWGLRPREVVTAAGPDHLVHSVAELAAVIDPL